MEDVERKDTTVGFDNDTALEPVVTRDEHDLKADAATVKEVHGNAAYHETIAAAPINPWSKSSFQFYGIFFIVALNATASGFDGSIFSSVNAMDEFKKYFGTSELSSASAIILSVYNLGKIAGALFNAPLCDYFGRRVGIACGSIPILIAAAILTAAQDLKWLYAGRFILGFGVAIGTSAAPTYGMELSPPHWRARFVGYYNTFFYTGSIISTGATYASNKAHSQLAFRLPIALQLIPPIIIIIGCIFIPESPRWLTSKGRKEQATKILAKYHGNGDVNHPVVQLEVREFEASIEMQRHEPSIWNYWELFKTHNARWRILMVTFMSLFAQLSGNNVLTYFLPNMYTRVGITSTDRRLLFTFANSILSCAGAVAGSATNDWLGRRTKLWVGSIVLAGLFGGVAGFSSQFAAGSTKTPSVTLSNAGVAFIFLFGMAYSFVYTPLTATYCAEVLDNHTRARGMSYHIVLGDIGSFYNSFVTPYALNGIDWKYYLLFVALNLFYGVLWFFYGVETHGRTLEELDEVFEAPFPPKASRRRTNMVEAGGRLHGLGE